MYILSLIFTVIVLVVVHVPQCLAWTKLGSASLRSSGRTWGAGQAQIWRAHNARSLQMSTPSGLDDTTRQFLDKTVKGNKVVLFMKGTALFPQCGFSNTAVRILDAVGTKFETVNVLESDKIRNGIKVYSSWPTIPQLYVGGEFVGGSDIMIELYNNGQLAEMVELANAQ